jgi:dsRNA-specific ribonuclease
MNSENDKSITNIDDDIVKTEEGLVFNPYNALNVEITLNEVQSILTKYGVPSIVNNLNLYKRAFVHRSYTKRSQIENNMQNITIVEKPLDCLPLKTKSNERLEFLGDGILELVTKYYLYRRFPKENEGFMTEKKIAIVKNEAIGKIALEMHLNKWLVLSKHAEEKKIRTNPNNFLIDVSAYFNNPNRYKTRQTCLVCSLGNCKKEYPIETLLAIIYSRRVKQESFNIIS